MGQKYFVDNLDGIGTIVENLSDGSTQTYAVIGEHKKALEICEALNLTQFNFSHKVNTVRNLIANLMTIEDKDMIICAFYDSEVFMIESIDDTLTDRIDLNLQKL